MSSIEQILPIFREILELPDLVFEINQRLDVIQRHLNSIYGVEGASVDLSGVDHGHLVGLADDDHSIYHNDARGDARYLKLSGGILTGNVTIPDGGTIGQATGPFLTFDDTNDYLEIAGCKVGIGTTTPDSTMHVCANAYQLSLGTPGTNTGHQAIFSFNTLDDGTAHLGSAGCKGWTMFARGDAYVTAAEQNDYGIAYWNGSSWISPFFIDSLTGNINIAMHNASTVGLQLAGTLIIASAAELNYSDGVTSSIQTQLDARCLESIFGTSISTGLLLDGTALKASAILQKYHAIDPSANVQTMLGSANNAAILSNIGAAALASPNFTGTPLAPDHGTAATDMLINVCYGTGGAPTASGTTEGTLFLNYTA